MAASFSMLSTFPPTQCGLATFAYALVKELTATGSRVNVVRVVDDLQPSMPHVTHQLVLSDPDGAAAAARALSTCDVAIVQHEYGIFGGRDGADVIELLEDVDVPVIVVLHTVLSDPTLHQHHVLARVIDEAAIVVTMTETARRRLLHGWDIRPEKVHVIAHGAADNRAHGPLRHRDIGHGRATILTWGLLGDGKGIEWALDALAMLKDLDPQPLYRIVGETHPRVLEREGQAYRNRLKDKVVDLGIESMVSFEDRYLDVPTLMGIIRDADVVLLPYDSRDQVTSGVLTEAVVAGQPVVSTRFPHAVELLSSGAGILVPQRDAGAIADALRSVLTEPGRALAMSRHARVLAPSLLWAAVAEQYAELGAIVMAESGVMDESSVSVA